MLEPREQEKILAAQTDDPEDAMMLGAARGDDIRIHLSEKNGRIALNWENTGAVGNYDYAALYDHAPAGAFDYLTLQWQYVVNQQSPYVTGTKKSGTKHWIGYCAYDYRARAYKLLKTAGPY